MHTRKLLTAEGYDRLKAELQQLIRVERPQITEIVSWAASLGDRSENADYQFNKQKLRQIDRRIRYLTKLFEVAERIEYSPVQEGKVFFGAWCTLENDDGQQLRFRVVGDEEVYGNPEYVSLKSPVVRACLGKQLDDDVWVRAPGGDRHWYITAIHYEAGPTPAVD